MLCFVSGHSGHVLELIILVSNQPVEFVPPVGLLLITLPEFTILLLQVPFLFGEHVRLAVQVLLFSGDSFFGSVELLTSGTALTLKFRFRSVPFVF